MLKRSQLRVSSVIRPRNLYDYSSGKGGSEKVGETFSCRTPPRETDNRAEGEGLGEEIVRPSLSLFPFTID